MLRIGLSSIINKADGLEVCREAGTCSEALKAIPECDPHLILLDLTLPDRSGLELLRDIQAIRPEIPVLIVSMHDEMLHAERALKAGARGYLMKGASGAQVIEAIRTVLEGRVFVSERLSDELLSSFSRRGTTLSPAPKGTLTDREFEVFRLIGAGKSIRNIAEQLGLSPKTVDVHRANIKQKLKVEDLPTLIRQAVCWVEGQRANPLP